MYEDQSGIVYDTRCVWGGERGLHLFSDDVKEVSQGLKSSPFSLLTDPKVSLYNYTL